MHNRDRTSLRCGRWALALVALALLGAGGCTTLLMEGNGPTDYGHTALAKVPPLSAPQAALNAPKVKQLSPGETTFVNVGETFKKAFSFQRADELLAGRRADGTYFIAKRNYWFPLVLLDDNVTVYRADGFPLATMSCYSAADQLGIIYKHIRYTRAQDDRRHESFYTGFATVWNLPKYSGDPATALRRRYIEKDVWITALGAFGKGTVNGKRYLQILWIPIPIGSAPRQ